MNSTVFKVVKIVVKVAGIAVPIAANYFADKELDEKITKKAAEAVTKAMKMES